MVFDEYIYYTSFQPFLTLSAMNASNIDMICDSEFETRISRLSGSLRPELKSVKWNT